MSHNLWLWLWIWVMDMSHPNYRLARKARPRRTTSRNNANLVYQDVINATKENLNQSGERFKWAFLIGHLVFTNEIVGRGVQRLVDKEKKGLVQREEELPVYDGQPAVKKARVSRTRIPCEEIRTTSTSVEASVRGTLIRWHMDSVLDYYFTRYIK